MPPLAQSTILTAVYPDSFQATWQQATLAVHCLEKALTDPPKDGLTPYLIHATVLFFVARDQQAFWRMYQSGILQALGLSQALVRLPTYKQLVALITSKQSLPEWQSLLSEQQAGVSDLAQYADEALNVQDVKAFRELVLSNGLPCLYEPGAESLQSNSHNQLFDMPSFDAVILAKNIVSGWKTLSQLKTRQLEC